MNKQECEILLYLKRASFSNQRMLAKETGYSLGMVNKTLVSLKKRGYITDDVALTNKAEELLDAARPKNAVILAAGYGMRMVPINVMQPKGMLEVHGEPLIERQIRQLNEAGVTNITVVVGFMKERFEYLIDKYGVDLVVNADYASKNNLSSLALVSNRISNTYVVPCDVWCDANPFNEFELYSWYMVGNGLDDESDVRANRRGQLVRVRGSEQGNPMIGISYIRDNEARPLKERLDAMAGKRRHDGDFWEDALFINNISMVWARVVSPSSVVEINTYEQLRDLDEYSNQLHSDAMDTIAEVFGVTTDEITGIEVLKKGMTNRSFVFLVNGCKYIMRIPGEGTDQLINRMEEADVYKAISGLGLCDDPVYINPQSGYKITKYLSGIRVCDIDSEADLVRCMKRLKEFHRMHLEVAHTFDIFEKIDFYESLWGGLPSEYSDYVSTKANVLSLREFVENQPKDWCLTHIDAVPDNFLFYDSGNGDEGLQLTDWEYAGMQDPHVDIAMFAIYSMYDKASTDRLIDIYFADEDGCGIQTRAKVYCYVAMCGLLWSNWCEYKRNLGIEFGEYSLAQYRYGKDFFKYATELIDN